jgi:hypothetical protein
MGGKKSQDKDDGVDLLLQIIVVTASYIIEWLRKKGADKKP